MSQSDEILRRLLNEPEEESTRDKVAADEESHAIDYVKLADRLAKLAEEGGGDAAPTSSDLEFTEIEKVACVMVVKDALLKAAKEVGHGG